VQGTTNYRFIAFIFNKLLGLVFSQHLMSDGGKYKQK
jgi:hypothetical protein